VQWHPSAISVATSGIENNVKVWQPLADSPIKVSEIESTKEANTSSQFFFYSFLRTLSQIERDDENEDDENEENENEDDDSGESGDNDDSDVSGACTHQ
jgi:Rieske Fe-S protein